MPKSFDAKKARIHIVKPYVLEEWESTSTLSKAVGSGSSGFSWHTGPAKRGDVVVFDSHTIHGAGMNFTKKFRCTLDMRFILAPPATTSSSSSKGVGDNSAGSSSSSGDGSSSGGGSSSGSSSSGGGGGSSSSGGGSSSGSGGGSCGGSCGSSSSSGRSSNSSSNSSGSSSGNGGLATRPRKAFNESILARFLMDNTYKTS